MAKVPSSKITLKNANFDDCASACDKESGCTAYEYECGEESEECDKKIDRKDFVCHLYMNAIPDEKQLKKDNEQEKGWQTCVKKVDSSCDSECGCGWYSSEKDLHFGYTHPETIIYNKAENAVNIIDEWWENQRLNKKQKTTYAYKIRSAEVCRPDF